MKSDLEIAQQAKMKKIAEIAEHLGISPEDIHLYGKYKAKVPLSYIDENKIAKSKLVLVTAITPTPAGEGKTTTSIGLAMGLNRLGRKTTVVLREPSLGPVFGVKGGAAGGGYAQVVPMEDINLHFTGDIAAVEKANNLLAAIIDNNIQDKKRSLGIDPRTVVWKRVMDMNDRALRQIIIGLGGTANGIPRETGFNITAASEVMAILCLSNNISELKQRLGNIFVGYTFDKKPVFARDLNAQGAMAALLKDAIMPNLVQTLENTPAIIHGGPFANIAQGTNSIVATKLGLSLSEIVVTEAGFATELGAEKFFDIKCRTAGLKPDAVVIVATIRALKHHGGAAREEYSVPNPDLVQKGLENLHKHIENIQAFGYNPVVALNKFDTDSHEEIAVVKDFCKSLGVKMALNEAWAKGSEGAIELAEVVLQQMNESNNFKYLYELDWSLTKKIETIATTLYGAKEVDFTADALKDLKTIESLGFDKMAVCMAKTQTSLSDNPKIYGRPKDFTLTVRSIEISSGAGFVVPICGEIMRMPGLPSIPAAENIDVDEYGNITGLF